MNRDIESTVHRGRGNCKAARRRGEEGATLVMILIFLVMVSVLAMSILFITEVEFRSSHNYMEHSAALGETDSALQEVMWRLNLPPGDAASLVTVNYLKDFDASISYDPLGILTNDTDDDGDGTRDEPDELNLMRDWSVKVGMAIDSSFGGNLSQFQVVDTDIAAGPPWGSNLVVPTVQPITGWREYSTADPTDPDALTIRFKLDTDTHVGDSEKDGPEIVFYDPELVDNGVDDSNTLSGLGGDGNAANDSPVNITWSGGGKTYPASGVPILLIEATGRAGEGAQSVAKRKVRAEAYLAMRSLFDKAMCGCTDLKLTGGGKVDSYSSSDGPYGTGPVNDNGDVGTNGELDVGGGVVVSGNAEAGTSIKFSGGNATVSKDATAGGEIDSKEINIKGIATPYYMPAPAPCECTALDVPGLIAQAEITNDNANILPDGIHPWIPSKSVIGKSFIYIGGKKGKFLKLGNDEQIMLTGGTYYFDGIDMSSAAAILIGTDSNNDMIPDGPPTETVVIYVNGDIGMSGKGLINQGSPTDVEIYTNATNVNISASNGFSGMVWAPDADFDLTGGASFYGALLGNTVKNSGGSEVHFDEDLMRLKLRPDRMRLLAWREVR